MPNIVQAEFFHVGGENITSLKQLLAECNERIIDDLEFVFLVRCITQTNGV